MILNAAGAQVLAGLAMVLSSVPFILPTALQMDATETARFLSYIVVVILWLIAAILAVSAAFLNSMDRLHDQRASENVPT